MVNVRHIFPGASSRQTVPGPVGFLLGNNQGDFASWYTVNRSRYEGWFVWDEERQQHWKALHHLELADESENATLIRTENSAFLDTKDASRTGYKLLPSQAGLSISLNRPQLIRLVVDIRPNYQLPNAADRQYSIEQDGNHWLIRHQAPDMPDRYLHVRCNGALVPDPKWRSAQYPADEERNSQPYQLDVFAALEGSASAFGLGFGASADEARKTSLAAFKQRPQAPHIGLNHRHDTILNQLETARASVSQGLSWLERPNGIWAGLPWFHQVWIRDYCLAALGLSKEKQAECLRTMLALPWTDGRLPRQINHDLQDTISDGLGWLCLLAKEYGTAYLPADIRETLRAKLVKATADLHAQTNHQNLIPSPPKTTWMDTLDRPFALEIQCMYALALELAGELTEDPRYERQRLRMLGSIREHYWKTDVLSDRPDKRLVKPNLFFAYLLQPDLLSANLWRRCFTAALKQLRTPWHGLASLGLNEPGVHLTSSGELPDSYHSGDSWFFVNNCAAIALLRFDRGSFGTDAVSLFQSSTSAILWQQLAGLPGEIASAYEGTPGGAGLQGFSSGTYLLLAQEIEDYTERHEAAPFWDPSRA